MLFFAGITLNAKTAVRLCVAAWSRAWCCLVLFAAICCYLLALPGTLGGSLSNF